ncbi:hypothetical protein FJ492_01785 [Mesorhizobium sp. B2-5-4]|nr:hypothetical protein FJ492_01785 [Mesorhizobium sp. B2-5-4]
MQGVKERRVRLPHCQLDSRQEAVLQATADKFIALHKGDPVKALKEMTVLNGHLQQRLDTLSESRKRQ